MANLEAYGHSWVAGEAATHESLGFVARVAQALGLTMINRGVGGSHGPDTAALVSVQPPGPADVYLVLTGLNDARRFGVTGGVVDAYTTALETIFEVLGRASPDALTITLEQPHLIDYSFHEPHNQGSNESIDVFNGRLREVAGRFPRVRVAEVADWDATTMLDDDTVHPNDAGHAALAAAVIGACTATPTR